MMDLNSRLQSLSKRRDLRAICNILMPLARRNTPLTREEKDALINIRGVYRAIVSHKHKATIDSVLDELLSR